MTRPVKKIRPRISQKAHVQSKVTPKPRAKHKAKLQPTTPRELRERGWMVAGFDTSMSSLAGAAIAYDATTKNYKGPVFIERRWSKADDYFSRIKTAAKSHELILDLQHELNFSLSMHEVWIAQEEPWPMGMVGKGVSAYLKQQAEISGAFLGGLVRYGYMNVSQIGSIRWRTMIADDLGITTHHTKWRAGWLANLYNCKPQDSGKFRSKQWALGPEEMAFAQEYGFEDVIPDWPDIIETAKGKIPRPEGSVAKAVQPDDRYDALAICWTHFLELVEEGTLKSGKI